MTTKQGILGMAEKKEYYCAINALVEHLRFRKCLILDAERTKSTILAMLLNIGEKMMDDFGRYYVANVLAIVKILEGNADHLAVLNGRPATVSYTKWVTWHLILFY